MTNKKTAGTGFLNFVSVTWNMTQLRKPSHVSYINVVAQAGQKTITIMRLLLISIFIAGTLGQVYACKCIGPPSVKESFKEVALIFHGRVVNKEVVSFQATFNSEKGQEIRERLKSNNDRFLGLFESPQVYKVTIEITEKLKGENISKTVTIFTTTSDGSCGFDFELNSDYLIYATRKGFNNSRFLTETERQQDIEKQNSFWTHLCSRTKKFDQKEIEELRALKE